jgi:putative tricarboxylic transport membrane protein
MKRGLLSNRDFWAGLMLMGLGAGAMVVARGYRFGSALRMGPGFFPMILGGIIIAFGICVTAVGIRSQPKIEGHVSSRAIVMLPLSLVLFGGLMQYTGFIPAVVALVFVSAASGREFKWLEVLVLTAVLTVASVGLFIWGLGLPYPLIKGM